MDIIKETFRETLSSLRYYMNSLLVISDRVALFMCPYICMALCEERTGMLTPVYELVIPVIMAIISYVLYIMRRVAVRSVEGIPVSCRRYTSRGEDGETIFKMSDVREAMAYLLEVEEYLQKYGSYEK